MPDHHRPDDLASRDAGGWLGRIGLASASSVAVACPRRTDPSRREGHGLIFARLHRKGAPEGPSTRVELSAGLTGLRRQAGPTIRELASQLGLPTATVADHMAGRRLSGSGHLERFARLLKAGIARWTAPLLPFITSVHDVAPQASAGGRRSGPRARGRSSSA